MQTRFRRNPQVYESFLDIMQMFKNDHKSAKELHQTVISIFQGHQDLIDEFTHFLP
ncbi:putative transcription regulator Others family [Medicago truncatula]|uniref:Putative transcription regulator Others family n=1 Tax=Medicago truncatula TaxID=3880 RepID=A0A396GTB7_MEDTR|nr:putative transcription regulator Others family [Medicago truncatula]